MFRSRLKRRFLVTLVAALPSVAPPAAIAAGEPALQVVTFGTSLTARGGWQQPLRQKLATCSGRPVVVKNMARSGESSSWGLANAGRVAAIRPDVVLIEFAVNDAGLHYMMTPQQSLDNMRAIVEAIRAERPDALIAVQAMNPAWGVKGLARPLLNRIGDAHLALAEDMGAITIDHRPHWNTYSPSELSKIVPDGLHPVPAASAPFIAEEIAGVLCAHLACTECFD